MEGDPNLVTSYGLLASPTPARRRDDQNRKFGRSAYEHAPHRRSSRIPTQVRAAPRLDSGDRMDSETFMAIYDQMPDGFRAQLIQGVVYVASPISTNHGRPNHHVSSG